MPYFSQYTYGTSPITTFIDTVLIPTLTTATDLSVPAPQKLNISVKKGLDEIFISGTNATLAADQMPCIRIVHDPQDYTINNNTNIPLFINVPIILYFFYAKEYPGYNFTEMRDAWIFSNFNYMKYNVFGDNIGITKPVPAWWKWDNNNNIPKIHLEHDIDPTYMGKIYPVSPKSDYGCSKATTQIMIQPWIIPNATY